MLNKVNCKIIKQKINLTLTREGAFLAPFLVILRIHIENTMKVTDFFKFLNRGQEGEHIIADYLIKKGKMVVFPTYQFAQTHAPFILGETGKWKFPDLVVFNNGKSVLGEFIRFPVFFAEVKTKTNWVHFPTKETFETGLNTNLYFEYKEIENKTGVPVFIFFIHEKEMPGGIYFSRLLRNDLRTAKQYIGGSGGKEEDMVFYKRESLTKLL